MSEPMPSIPTQSTFTYPNPNPSASPSFTQDDTSESFIPEPTQPIPTFTQTAFSQPAFSQPNQSIFSQPAVHFQQTQPTQTNQTGQQYPNNVQSQQFQQFQTASISANNAKFPYLEKDKYEIWAMKMEYWIQNADHNLWRIVQQGNTPKWLGKYAKGNTIIHPHVSLDEHVAVQRENKLRLRFGGMNNQRNKERPAQNSMYTEFSVTEEEGLHKGYNRFQKIPSQLNQVQARPDNDDINLKFLRALPSSWSQVALALKTRGGLESMSFDDLYNKLRSLELDVRIGHSYGVKAAAAPTHSAFIGAASSGSKLNYSNQQSIVPSVSQTSGRSDSIMECVLHSFVAENEPDQDMIYEDFDQVDQLEMEELDLKWQMAMLSLRINRFEKKAGRKMNYNNQQPARFDRRKVRCYKCLQLGHFARECNVKTVDDKARYSAFKVTEVKQNEQKKLCVSVDSLGELFAMMGISPKVHNCPLGCDSKINDLNNMYNNLDRLYNDCYIKVQAYQNAVKTLESQKDWYHKTQIALEEKIRILSANLENTTNTLSYTEKLHDQAQTEKKEWEVKFEATLARFEKWKESSKNLQKLINSSMSTRTKIGLGFKEYFGKDEVFDLSTPSVFDPEPVEEDKPLYSWFVKAGEMHAVPPSITGTYMPTSYKSDIEETQVSYGSKSDNNTSETLSESNDFVSCDNSDKSSDSETYASCDSSLKTKTKDFPPAVDIKTLSKSDVEDPNSTSGNPSFSCLENVKSPRIFCNKSGMNNRNVCKNNSVRVKKCFVCGSKLHLIKDCDFYNCVDSVPCKSKAASVPAGSRNSSASVTAGGSDPAASRNRPAVNSAGRPKPTERVGHPAGWSKRPAPVSAGRPVSAGWLNPAARPYFRPSSVYFNNMYWPELYDPMYMNEGRWGTAGDPSTDNDIGIVDSGCSRSMTGNKEKLDDFVQVKGGIVKFGGGDGRISGKGTIRTSKLDFENVYYVEELQHFNLFSLNKKVKGIRCDNGTEFKKAKLIELCGEKGIKRDYSNPRTPQQNGIAERKNRTLIEAARNQCFADSKYLPCFGLRLKVPQIGHLKPFGCQVTILNTSDHLGKFKGKAEEGYLVGYAPNSKAYRVYNLTNKRVEETMNLRFLEDKPNVQGIVRSGILLYIAFCWCGICWYTCCSVPAGGNPAGSFQPACSYEPADQGNPAVGTSVSANFIPVYAKKSTLPPGQSLGSSENTTRFPVPSDVEVNPVPTKRVNTIHPQSQILGDLASPVLTRSRAQKSKFGESAFIGYIQDQQRTNHTDQLHCLFACFLSQLEPSSIAKALEDPDWVAAMQEEMQQFINQKVWKLVPLPHGKHAIGTKWILKNKRSRGIMDVKIVPFSMEKLQKCVYVDDIIFGSTNKAWCEEFEVLMKGEFEMSAMGEMSFFISLTCEIVPDGFLSARQVYVDDIIFGSTNKELCTGFEKLIKDNFQMSSMGELTFFLGLQVQEKEDGIFISQDKYVAEILKKFNYTDVKSAFTLVDLEKPLVKDGDADDVDVHLYRSMIGSLMYLMHLGQILCLLFIAFASSFKLPPKDITSLSSQENFLVFKSQKATLGLKVGDEAVHKELGDRMERAATTTSSLEAEQDSGSGPRCQDTILGDVDAQTSDGFHEIIDFLNANQIRYALTVNPIIYTSCIQQFWATAKANTINGEHQLQALIDKKKVIITESSIRSDLHLEDAEGTDCLPTATIFKELARMGYEKPSQKLTFYKAFFSPQWKFLIHTITQCLSAKSTAWNEFSSTMASLIICLATN
ncbi:putative ribonuclease H-like domain-containing protein [Tanacetum coccineum]